LRHDGGARRAGGGHSARDSSPGFRRRPPMMLDPGRAHDQVSSCSGAVALIVFGPPAVLFGDPFFPRLVAGVHDVLRQRGTQLVLLTPQSASDSDRAEKYVAAGHAD